MRTTALVSVLAASMLVPAVTEAQPTDASIAADLADARRESYEGRRLGGWMLLIGGATTAVAGGTIAAIGHDDPYWLWFGLGNLAWGTVNAILGLPLLDLGGGQADEIEAGRELRGRALAEAREAEIRSQQSSAAFFAFNFGLDFLYVGSGILLYLLAPQLDDGPRDSLRGYALSQIIQGSLLFAFDLLQWISSNVRADRAAAVPMVSF